jgi:hypothetical protein
MGSVTHVTIQMYSKKMKWIVTYKEAAVSFLISNFALLKNYNTISFIEKF